VAVSKDGLQYRFVIPGTSVSTNCAAKPPGFVPTALPYRQPRHSQHDLSVRRDAVHIWKSRIDRSFTGVTPLDLGTSRASAIKSR
jgi:hypothetical protein